MKLLDKEFVRRFYPGPSKYFTHVYRIFFGNLEQRRIGIGHRLFLKCYFFYKRWLEDPFLPLTRRRPELFKGGHILDVGACIGYTAELFSRAADADHLVYAFEPEPGNQRILKYLVEKEKLRGRIKIVPDAVGSCSGMTEIWKNPIHHGDHRIATAGLKSHSPAPEDLIKVRQWSLDDFCEKHGIINKITFVKIDVQGYEVEVLKGMGRVLSSNPKIVLAVEYSPVYVDFMGEESRRFFDTLSAHGLNIYFIKKNGELAAFQSSELDRLIRRRGYTDLLCSRVALS